MREKFVKPQREVLFAENGRDGIDLLKHTLEVDAILVDVMMPDIDGYETMREIRRMRKFRSPAKRKRGSAQLQR